MNALTVAILRVPSRLVALVSTCPTQIATPRYGDPLLVDPYVELTLPLEDVADLNRDCLRELQLAWHRLSEVTVFDEAVAADIREVLAMTIPDDVHSSIEPWRPPVLPKLPRATAAHPRAFRGTKTQPPSQQQPPAVDLRPHLCNLRDLRAILEYVRSLPLYTSKSDQFAFDASSFQEMFAAPKSLRICLWMISVGAKVSDFDWRNIVGQYWSLRLDENEPLRRAVARVLRDPWSKERLSWLQALHPIEPDRREAVLVSLLECVRLSSSQASDLANKLSRMSEQSDSESFRNRSWAFAQAIQRGASLDSLLSGFEMANRYQPDHDFVNKEFDDLDPCPDIIAWIDFIKGSSNASWNRESNAMGAWDDCGFFPGLSKLFDQRNWSGLNPDDAMELFKVFRNCRFTEMPESMRETFAVLVCVSSRYFEVIRNLPSEYRSKGINLFQVVAGYWEGKQLPNALERILDILPVVCAEPFDKRCESAIYSSMLNLVEKDFVAWSSGPMESMLTLDRASRNHNEATLIAIGLNRLARSYSTWLVNALANSATAMLKCAHTFGCLSKTQHIAAMESVMNHPIYNCEELELRPLACLIVEHLPHGVHDPVPRKVKAILRGEVTLTEGQEARAKTKIQTELLRTKIELARHSALEVLATALGIAMDLAEHKAAQHAVKIQNLAMENRRALRKFLRAYLSGEEDYLNKHSANLRWLKSHPAVSFERWRTGPATMQRAIDGHVLSLTVELNPLEALQLGTYVGSCLGIGGMLAVSAAAVVLDINKTVVYARNQQGKVIARQLLAISEQDQLVAFSVYPNSVSPAIKQMFTEYDRAFAAHLGIRLHEPDSGTEYPEIARPISSYWWDDTAWNFEPSF